MHFSLCHVQESNTQLSVRSLSQPVTPNKLPCAFHWLTTHRLHAL